jgi:hypothetical protein
MKLQSVFAMKASVRGLSQCAENELQVEVARLSTNEIIISKWVGDCAVFFGALILSLVLVNWPTFLIYRQALFVDSALHGNIGRMRLLLAFGADANGFECPTPRCRTPLIAAVQRDQYEAVQLLLARGADVNKKMKRGQTALMMASYYDHAELVRLFLANGADVNGDFEGDTALNWAKEKHHPEIVELLIAAGATK